MTRCNGFCSGGRAIPEKRTPAGIAAPSAQRREHCCAAFAIYCGDVEAVALANLLALPDHHAMQNLDVDGTSRACVEEQSEALASQAFGGLRRLMVQAIHSGVRSYLVCWP
jgi:hypothetical protein